MAADAHSIVLYCNYVTGGWSPVNKGLLNGSEEAIVQAAEYWARQGHQVFVHQNGFVGTCQGVEYLPREQPPARDNLDLLITFKTLEHINTPAKARVFWTADLPSPGNAAGFLPPRIVDSLTAIICLSEWHRQQILVACPWVSPDKVKAFWIGVDETEIAAFKDTPKVPGRCVYASSHDRGLHLLLDLWTEIRQRLPYSELHVLYGWDFWLRSEAIIAEEVRLKMVAERQMIERKLRQPGITYIGRLTSREGYLREMAEAQVWPYPCTGGELCCKVALEAQALGVVPVVWPTMALSETVLSPEFHVPVGDGTGLVNKLVEVFQALPQYQDKVRREAHQILTWSDMAQAIWTTVERQIEPPEGSPKVEDKPTKFKIPSRSRIGRDNLDIVFAVPGMPFVGDTDKKQSLGGSETMGLQVARELSRRGHRVTVYSVFPEGSKPEQKYDGVTYLPITEIGKYLGAYTLDAYIVQRDPVLMNVVHRARVAGLWCHDLGLLRYHGPFRGSLWNLDYVIPVSHWHGGQLREVYGLQVPEIIAPMRNGIDLGMLRGSIPKNPKREKNALVYAARPERGLDLLLERIYARLLERNPKLPLYVAGYDNTVPDMKPFYDYCQDRIRQYGSRAKWMGHLKKPDLYNLYARSRAYLYPTKGFEEVSPLRGDTLIDTPEGRIPIEQLWREKRKDFWLYAYDPKTQQMTLAKAAWVRRTRRNAEMITLHFKHGRGRKSNQTGSITLTPDHEIMLRDGSYCRADQIQTGDRVMPFNRRLGGGGFVLESGKRKKYSLIGLDNQGHYVPEHIFVMEHILGRKLLPGELVDHVDGDTNNNHPSNLKAHSGHGEHCKDHWDRLSLRERKHRVAVHVGFFHKYHTSLTSEELSAVKSRAALIGWEKRRAVENHIITRIEKAEKADAYCMEVPGPHNFVANSIVVHNCLSAMECAACGLPFVASAWGALPETTGLCPGFAELVSHSGEATEKYVDDFVNTAWNVITNEEKNNSMSLAGTQGSDVYSIEKVAEEWEDFLLGAIEQRSQNVSRTFLSHMRRGDSYGARALTSETALDGPGVKSLVEQVKTLIPDTPHNIPLAASAQLVQAIQIIFQGRGPRTLRAASPESEVVVAELLHHLPGVVEVDDVPADLVVGHESLDTAPDPSNEITRLESMVSLGGWVVTLTAGPGVAKHFMTEAGLRAQPRGRWVFDNHDITDLLGKKVGLAKFSLGGHSLSAYDDSPLSWTVLFWRPGSGETGQINLQRRAELQAPDLSVSACIISKNAEGMLHRCLRSIRGLCDEIILGDDSSTDDTHGIASRYGADIFPISSPREVGFCTARNLTLERAKGDFVLWIDTDEELLELSKVPKYLRWNTFSGYGLRQHHFSAIPENAFKPDLPVRLFRRVLLNEKLSGIRFFGIVHEHPEVEINQSVGESVVLSDVHIAHDGYLTETGRRKRFDRNINLMFRDRVTFPERMLGKFLMIRDWVHLARYEMTQNGNQLTPTAVEYLEAAVDLYRKNFLGRTHIMGIDGLQYYNEALTHLRRGYDVQINVKVAGLSGASGDLVYAGRVESQEDLLKMVTDSLKEFTGVWKGKYI